ncbi:MAG: superoxide dismutase family protein [Planctomycetes bacterium]|nr:superoxide dismutase family protein [Planctomycetota bacterium]
MRLSLWLFVPVLAAVGFAVAPQKAALNKLDKKVVNATAVIHATKGQTAAGVVKFERIEDGCKITWDLSGLAPGKHGFHIHEFGDCNCDDGKCAGGHFNPEGKKHGGPASPERHVGDLGNIEAAADGTSKGEMTDKLVRLNGDRSVVGRAVILHEKADDETTDPTGNAGARVGIGVIGIAKEQ